MTAPYSSRSTKSQRQHAAWTFVLIGVVLMLGQSGCSRMFWRSQADFDTYNQLLQKTQDPRWDLPRLTVEADPGSRFFDGANPDKAPLPPDDPAAHVYMHVVDGMPGYKSWHKFGDTMSVENPQWLSNFEFAPVISQAEWARPADGDEVPEKPTIRDLTLEQAIELANIHSREYQTQIENVYLSSLLLTFDRFQFNVRYLGFGGEPSSNLTYLNTPSVRDDLAFNGRFGVSQLLPTGGQWVLELANNTIWLFSGDNQTSTSSLLSYSVTQPLLLGAGRKIVLENLTQSERAVLYDVRTLARFRKIFFGDIVVNGNGGGFLGLLRQQQQVNNQRGNIQALAVQIERLREINSQQFEPLEMDFANIAVPPEFRGKFRVDDVRKRIAWQGTMQAEEREQLLELSDNPNWDQAVESLFSRTQSGVVTLDLAQLLTRLSSQENSLRDAERQLLDSLDQYKFQLGLPTDFQLSIDTGLLKQFQLIDPRINEIEVRILDFKRRLATINEFDPTLEQVQAAAAGVEELRQLVRREGLDLIEEDFRRVDDILPERLAGVSDPLDQEIIVKDLERNRVVYRDVVLDEFSKATQLLRAVDADLDKPGLTTEELADILTTIDVIREDLLQLTQSLRAVQAGLRSELITIHPFSIGLEEAVQTALENRLDLMNARGQVMDARRQMEVAANRLEAVLNVVATGDIGTSGGTKPFDFRGDRSTFRAGLQVTAPLDQVLERNAYRQSQINYQRARRAYMELEDQIKLQVRTEWRQLQVLKQNLETARQNLRIAAVQLDSAVENFNAPARPGQQGGSGSGNLGLNLLNALTSVLNAQNELIRIWVQYEQNRINIHRDMDIMQVDERGLWIDPVYQNLPDLLRKTPTESEPADELLPPGPLPDDRAQPLPAPPLPVDDGSDAAGTAQRTESSFVEPQIRTAEARSDSGPAGGTGDGWRPRTRPPGLVRPADLRATE